MSENDPEDETVSGISDDQLPEDLVPGEDNPLASGLDDGESPGDLLHDGRPAEQDDDSTGTDSTDSGDSTDVRDSAGETDQTD